MHPPNSMSVCFLIVLYIFISMAVRMYFRYQSNLFHSIKSALCYPQGRVVSSFLNTTDLCKQLLLHVLPSSVAPDFAEPERPGSLSVLVQLTNMDLSM
jgi:hypothetical protein